MFLLFIQKVDKAIHWIFIHTVATYRIVQKYFLGFPDKCTGMYLSAE